MHDICIGVRSAKLGTIVLHSRALAHRRSQEIPESLRRLSVHSNLMYLRIPNVPNVPKVCMCPERDLADGGETPVLDAPWKRAGNHGRAAPVSGLAQNAAGARAIQEPKLPLGNRLGRYVSQREKYVAVLDRMGRRYLILPWKHS